MTGIVLEEISKLFRSEIGEEPSASQFTFVDDESIEYDGTNLRVSKSALVPYSQVEPFLLKYSEGGPSWIHFQQYVQTDSNVLVTVRRGSLIGAKQPSINTSLTRNYRIEFI